MAGNSIPTSLPFSLIPPSYRNNLDKMEQPRSLPPPTPDRKGFSTSMNSLYSIPTASTGSAMGSGVPTTSQNVHRSSIVTPNVGISNSHYDDPFGSKDGLKETTTPTGDSKGKL